MNVVIIGAPCTGKTTLCKMLENYGFEHVSIDQFRKKDWESFKPEDEKEIYEEFFKYVIPRDNLVIDTPGISPFFQERKHMIRDALFIKLECSLEECLRRLERRKDQINVTPSLLRWLYLSAEKLPAHVVINTEELTPAQVLRKALEAIRRHEKRIEDKYLDELLD